MTDRLIDSSLACWHVIHRISQSSVGWPMVRQQYSVQPAAAGVNQTAVRKRPRSQTHGLYGDILFNIRPLYDYSHYIHTIKSLLKHSIIFLQLHSKFCHKYANFNDSMKYMISLSTQPQVYRTGMSRDSQNLLWAYNAPVESQLYYSGQKAPLQRTSFTAHHLACHVHSTIQKAVTTLPAPSIINIQRYKPRGSCRGESHVISEAHGTRYIVVWPFMVPLN